MADSGSGVSRDDKEKLFLPYFSTKNRGTGLGLAIVSHIVAEHNAHIRVEDNQPAGARFTVEIPALLDDRRHRKPLPRPAAVESMKPRRILVVDDEPGIRQSLSGVLEDEGYAVEAVESGEAAWRRCRAAVSNWCCWTSGCPAWTAWRCWRASRRCRSPSGRWW